MGLAAAALAQGDATAFTVLWLPAATLLPLLAAWWLHVRIEAPALRWGRTLAISVGRRHAPFSAG